MTNWRILIVEDEDDAAVPMSALLEVHGYRCSVAGTAAEAMVEARRLRPDLLLLDIGLPDMDGLDLLQRLREEGVLTECRVLAVTGSIDDATRERCRDVGCHAFYPKPVDIDLILSVLGELDQ
ncbi:MAG TPA: response regulator [Thermoanaerobaculia bacterium]|nr:response regulator [Thermoanaerobaculia bacterium]